MANNATRAQVLQAVQSNNNKILSLIDIREPEKKRIPRKIENAVNIPRSELIEAFKLSNDEFLAKYGVNLPEENGLVIFHCNSGKGSGTLVNGLEEMDGELWGRYCFKHFPGGVLGWEEGL